MFEPNKFVEKKIGEIKDAVQGKALVALSGGVDSTTAAVLVNKALGKKLLCVFVDTGFVRKGEPERVADLAKALNLNFKSVDAQSRFYEKLKGITEPEAKRKAIGEEFIRVFEEVAKEDGIEYLVQGTIAPDWIESGGELRDTIKSHHNVGGLPKDMKVTLVEPLRDLYKDEVRALGKHLGLPEEFYQKQPFPGPGLAVRILGEATEERARIVREACAIVEEEIESAAEEGKMELPWQYFAVLLPVKTVGVQGDLRAHGYIIAVRAVASADAMSASYSKISHDVLEKISIRITNELKEDVCRVVYDITNKPPGTIEYE